MFIFCTVKANKPRHIQTIMLEALFDCVSGACPCVPTVRRQNGCDSATHSFRKCRCSEALTFDAACICDAFWRRESCRDHAFTARHPFSTEGDAEIEPGGVSFVTGIRRTLERQHTPNPTCVYISALPGCWSRDFIQVCMNTQRTTSFFAHRHKHVSKAR